MMQNQLISEQSLINTILLQVLEDNKMHDRSHRAQYISNAYKNSSLNVALPVILNGIEKLANAESNSYEQVTYERLHTKAYKELRKCFCMIHNIQDNEIKTSWTHFDAVINEFGNNFLIKERMFAPVLRLFIAKQISLAKQQIEGLEEKIKIIDLMLAQIQPPQEIELTITHPAILQKLSFILERTQDFILNINREELADELTQTKEKLSKRIEIINYMPLSEEEISTFPITIEQANEFLYQHFGIEYHFRTKDQPVLKANELQEHHIFIISTSKPNKYRVDAKAFDLSLQDLKATHKNEQLECQKNYLKLRTSKPINEFTKFMLRELELINEDLQRVPNVKKKDLEEESSNIQNGEVDNFDESFLQPRTIKEIQTQKTTETTLQLETTSAVEEDQVSELGIGIKNLINSDLQFVMISLAIFATLALAAAIILCPPIGIVATAGLSAGLAWLASTTVGAVGLILGYSTGNMFFSSDNKNKDNLSQQTQEQVTEETESTPGISELSH